PGSNCYSTSPQLTQTQTELITTTASVTRMSLLDGVGNTVQTQLVSDPEGVDYVDISYDGLGQKISQSNPHRSAASSTDGVTQYHYDGLGRITDVIQPDNNVVHTDYVGTLTYGSNQVAAATTVTDETGRQKRTGSDALGRLVRVDEPNIPWPATGASATITIGGSGIKNVQN